MAKKPKQAAGLADPAEHPEEFVEGWEAALERERTGGVVEEAGEEEQEEQEEREQEQEEQRGLAPEIRLNGVETGVEGLSLGQEVEEAPFSARESLALSFEKRGVDLMFSVPLLFAAAPIETADTNGGAHDEEEDLMG